MYITEANFSNVLALDAVTETRNSFYCFGFVGFAARICRLPNADGKVTDISPTRLRGVFFLL